MGDTVITLNHLVDSTKNMDDNGPQPRIKYKKVQKRRNGADRFRDDHREDYEDCHEQVGDEVKRARRHNKTVPVLHDELKKRKSITTITTINLKDVSCDFDLNCSACAKLITLKELQRLNVKPRCKSTKQSQQEKEIDTEMSPKSDEKKIVEKQSRHKHKLIGVKKPKDRSKLQPNISLKKNFTNRSCQCIIDYKHNEICLTVRSTKSAQEKNVQDIVFEEIKSKPDDEGQPGINTGVHQNIKTNSKQTVESQNRSNSSYNSFLSLDHEPMDYN